MAVFKRLSADTRRLVRGEEGREVDFKAKVDAIQGEDYVAMANGAGGTILVGVAEIALPNGLQGGKIVGCTVSDKARRTAVNRAKECRPSVQIRIRAEDTATRRPIFRIDVPEGSPKPSCTASGTSKIRADGQYIAIDPPPMKAIILKLKPSDSCPASQRPLMGSRPTSP